MLSPRWQLSLVSLCLYGLASGQAKQHVTPDFLFTQAGRIFSFRWTSWVGDHELVMQDGISPELITWNPATGKKGKKGNLALLQKSYKAATGTDFPGLFPPLQFSKDGRYGLYRSPTNLYVIDFDQNAVSLTGVKPNVSNVTLSPDGHAIAYVEGRDLYSYDVASKESHRLTSDGGQKILNGDMTWVYWEEIFNHESRAYWWSNDSKSIAYFRTDESPVPETTFVGFKPQYPALVTQIYPKPGQANPSVRLGVVPASGGETRWVSPPIGDYEYIVGAKWSRDKLLFETMNRAQTDLTIWEAGDSGPVKLAEDANQKWIDVNSDFDFVDDGHSLIFTSGRTGYQHIYRADLDDPQKAVSAVTKGNWQVVSAASVFSPTNVYAVDQKNGLIYFGSTKDSCLQSQIYCVKTDGTGLKKISKEAGVHQPSFSPDGRFYVDSFTNPEIPTKITLNSSDGHLMSTLSEPNTAFLKTVALSPEQRLFIPARDGFKLPAIIRKPPKMIPGHKYPVIMEIYGGPEAPTVSDSFNFSWADDQLYADAGYVVVHVDNRSSMIESRKWVVANIGKFYGKSECDDFVDAARWLKRQPYVDPNRVGITGWSGGGGNTLNCMCRSKEFAAGIAGAPYVDPAFYDTFYSEHLYGLPKEHPEAYANPTWKDAKNLHGRLLLMWGTGDDNVHPQHEQTFLDECIKAGKMVQVMIYPMRKHGFGDLEANKHRLLTFLDFWKHNL